ncbi:MAG: hypothetical protein WD045_11030 [Pirellulaceae bacterium]
MLRKLPAIRPFALVFPLFLLALTISGRSADAVEPVSFDGTTAQGQVANLKDTLEKGLKCRLEREFRFVDRVVIAVDEGDLPVKMVLEMFSYARRKNQHRPFVYFERGMIIRAAELGIKLEVL